MIPAELASLLEPLERFEKIRRVAVRLGDRLCDLSYANPPPALERAARSALADAVADENTTGLQYSPFGGHTRTRRAVADGLRRRFELAFRYDDVVLTPGATAALQLALRAAGEPGDEVVVPVPCWLDHPLCVRHLGLEPVPVPLEAGTFELEPAAIADAIGPRTCAVLLGDPANPTGRVHSRGRLAAVAEVLDRAQARFGREITWIADEAHRDFAPAGLFHGAAAAWPATIVVYSYGKYHCIQGQRAGYAAVSPRHPRRERTAAELARWMRIMGFGAPTALMQRAVPRLEHLEHDFAWLDRRRASFVNELTTAGYEVVRPDATFFVYVRVPDGWTDDFAFVEMLAQARALVLPAPVFHHSGYVRLSLTAPEQALQNALEILCSMAPVHR